MGESVFWDKVIHNLLNLSTALLSKYGRKDLPDICLLADWGKD